MTAGFYAYGIVGRDDAGVPPVDGIDAQPVRVVSEGDLAAVVSEVDVGQFEGDALTRNAAQPGWLEGKVRAHELVLDLLVANGAVIPMRFGSIFSNEDVVHHMLRESSRSLIDALSHVRGKDEWGVKVYLDTQPTETSRHPVSTSGRDYLMLKREQLQAADRAREVAGEVAEHVHAVLSKRAVAAALMPVRDEAQRTVLNAAYLVPEDGRDDFMREASLLEETHDRAFLLEITGPWPPYNFTSVDVSGAVS